MSKFTTTIAVDVNTVSGNLPPQSHISAVRLGEDKKSIVIEWEQDEWRTPYTVPVEVSPDALAGKQPLPETVKCKRVQNEEVAPVPQKKAKKTQ